MVSTENMFWDSARRTLLADASDFGPGGLRFIRAYADACDEGLDVLNPKTGKIVRFVVAETDYEDGEGGAPQRWRLVPASPAARARLNITLVIFND